MKGVTGMNWEMLLLKRYEGGRRDEGGGWSRIKYDNEMMEHVEHNTTIEHNVRIENGIEDY